MRNIQVIDSGINCFYPIYMVEDDLFDLLFPGFDQDVSFVEDIVDRFGEQETGHLLIRATSKPASKAAIVGLHGMLFVGKSELKQYFPNRREADLGNIRFTP